MDTLEKRSEILVDVFKEFVDKDDTILEIGCGDGRNLRYLSKAGYDPEGIDKSSGTSIETVEPHEYDVVFTMSTLFLIPPENEWVFEKIAKMARKLIITFEGESTKGSVYGRDYNEVFSKFGFKQLRHQAPMFNEYGHLRIFKRWKN